MAVITISRQFGSGGNEIARQLCDRLGLRYFDKDLMMRLCAQAGLAPDTVIDLSEDRHQARGLLERLFCDYPAPMADPAVWAAGAASSAQRQLTVAQVRYLIRAAYVEGNVVVVGRGGQVVLRDKPDVLHVRVVAPLPLRIRRVQERERVTADAARELVNEHDRASADFVQYYFDADPSDPQLYDLIVNTQLLPPAAAAELIVQAVASLPHRP